MSNQSFRVIVLTGPPGCGKTTLIKKICDILKAKSFNIDGFFTEEVKCGGERIGFDVVLLNGKRATLARVKSGDCQHPKVGKYVVDVKSFETCVLPILNFKEKRALLVVDEIGKMELLSKKFDDKITEIVTSQRYPILATIPSCTKKPFALINLLRAHPNACLFKVNSFNRDKLVDEIISTIVSAE